MPHVNMTVTQEQRETIKRLNELLDAQEVKSHRPTRGSWYERIARPTKPVCDACQKRLMSTCVNLVIDMSGAFLRLMKPLDDRPGCVIVRYHKDCYPKKLVEWMNTGFDGRRGRAEDE